MPVCETCGTETAKVRRVVVDRGYDRSADPAVYNCPDCFERKDAERRQAGRAGRENDAG